MPASRRDPGGGTGAEVALLAAGLRAELLPRHVAVVMDGNSRWARARGLPSAAGHEAGRRVLEEVVRLSRAWGVRALTAFAFSHENWSRPKKTAREAEEATRNNSRLDLTLAISYSWRRDIVQACRNLAQKVRDKLLKPEDIDESLFADELETSHANELPDYPDLLIRTSGELRLSNFLLWQSAYAELFFTDTLWPDFGEADYLEALVSFQSRDRRFGLRKL
ncbi:unnamed protein product [Miscanthus lutarioriparius]|uniref:Alkyl transferase n=1 Tax=Miscanthus lutarioriparius TaxID=422564 RepID=A0A811NSB6_9POAL|nr:unnamed protein product [Miscanthus lutarioriparius]